MKKLIIVTLVTGFLAVQAPIQALKSVDHNALAQAAAAEKIIATQDVNNKAKTIAALKALCTKTNTLRNVLVAGGVLSATVIAAYAYTYGLPVDYLMSLISTPVEATCNEGFVNLGAGCVKEIAPTAFDVCHQGFANLGAGCLEAIAPIAEVAAAGAFDTCNEGMINFGTGCLEAIAPAAEVAAAAAGAFDACHEGFINLGAGCVETCQSGFSDVAGECVEAVCGLTNPAEEICRNPSNLSSLKEFFSEVVPNVARQATEQVTQNSTIWNSILSGSAKFFGLK